MSFKPIVLWTRKATLTSDDACTSILQYELPASPFAAHPPYRRDETNTDVRSSLSYVPPLRYFCLRALVEYPEQVHVLGPARILYKPPSDKHDFDVLQALVPAYRPFSPEHQSFDLRFVDPRLWAVLAQVFYRLPAAFRTYTLPLSDTYLPLLQAIPSTQHFSLVTVLSLSKCRELTDNTVVTLRHVHTLAALDASVTALGSLGVQRFAKSLLWSDGDEQQPPERRGPWGLRVLYLKDCINIDDKVLPWLSRFPLLSVVDLRGTVCAPWSHPNLPFKSSSESRLYHPSPLLEVLALLASSTQTPRTLFANSSPYFIVVDSLQHKEFHHPAFHVPTRISDLRNEAWRGGYDGKEENISERGWINSHEDEDRSDGDRHNEEKSEDESQSDSEEQQQPPGPYDMSDHQFGEGLRPRRIRQQPNPYAWMDRVAKHEDEEYVSQRRLTRFYAPPPPRRELSITDLPRSHDESLPVANTANRLMLFRKPPPWSTLPSCPSPKLASRLGKRMPTSVFSTTFSSNAHRPQFADFPLTRKDSDADVAPAAQARKRMRAITSMQNMFNLVQKRSSRQTHASTSTSRELDAASGGHARKNANPFVRNAQTTPKVAAAPKASVCPPDPLVQAAPPVAKVPGTVAESHVSIGTREIVAQSPTKRPLTVVAGERTKPDGDIPRPAKKLKPISTIPVPDWPIANLKPLSAHKPMPKARKQTTLQVSRAAPSSLPRRLSAPMATTNRLEMVEDKQGDKVDKPKSKAGVGREARKSSGGYDWKSWSRS